MQTWGNGPIGDREQFGDGRKVTRSASNLPQARHRGDESRDAIPDFPRCPAMWRSTSQMPSKAWEVSKLLEHAKQPNVGAPRKHADDRPRFGTACALVGARK